MKKFQLKATAQDKMLFPCNIKTVFALVLLSFLLFGCSAQKQQTQQTQHLPPANVPPAYKPATENYWWRCQFKIGWPENSNIDWGMDVLLAHAVISPILKDHYRDISYWRFHRRAARDGAGHQFSFIFYSKPETAASVYRDIQQSSTLQHALEADLVEKVITGDPENPELSNIEDTSDPAWPLDLQKNWPSFIMGVSSLWLGLINEALRDSPDEIADINLLLAKYREVDDQVTLTWRNEGQHALLHHLNAIFGYNPLFVRKMLTF